MLIKDKYLLISLLVMAIIAAILISVQMAAILLTLILAIPVQLSNRNGQRYCKRGNWLYACLAYLKERAFSITEITLIVPLTNKIKVVANRDLSGLIMRLDVHVGDGVRQLIRKGFW